MEHRRSGAVELTTSDGIAIGSTWAEHADVITVDPLDSCYQVGYGDAGGVALTLLSEQQPFATADDAGNMVPGKPNPKQVTVTAMTAGRLPAVVGADC